MHERPSRTHYSWRDNMGIVLSLPSSMITIHVALIDGKVVLEKGHLTTMDKDEILAEAMRQGDPLANRLAAEARV